MTIPDKSMGDRSRDEVLAGEYVLGVLGAQARRQVEARMLRDRQFAAIVHRWEENLASFDEDYEVEAPPVGAYRGIEARLFSASQTEAAPAVGLSRKLWNSLPLWRGVAFVSIGAALVLAGLQFAPSVAQKPNYLVATMSGSDRQLGLLASFDRASGLLQVVPVAAGGPAARSLELWLVEDGKAPRSLGVLPQGGMGELVIAEDMRRRLAQGVVLAVSLEPFGGSPTGQATGPVIASGELHN